MHRRILLPAQAYHPQRPPRRQGGSIGGVHRHLQQGSAIHPEGQAVVGRQAHREEAGATGGHIGGQHLGDLRTELDRIDPHRIEGELGRGIPELAEGLRRHSVTGLAGEQGGGTAGYQLGQHRRTQPLGHQRLLTLLPIGGPETAEAPAQGEG